MPRALLPKPHRSREPKRLRVLCVRRVLPVRVYRTPRLPTWILLRSRYAWQRFRNNETHLCFVWSWRRAIPPSLPLCRHKRFRASMYLLAEIMVQCCIRRNLALPPCLLHPRGPSHPPLPARFSCEREQGCRSRSPALLVPTGTPLAYEKYLTARSATRAATVTSAA